MWYTDTAAAAAFACTCVDLLLRFVAVNAPERKPHCLSAATRSCGPSGQQGGRWEVQYAGAAPGSEDSPRG
jgi:hypothetical protein